MDDIEAGEDIPHSAEDAYLEWWHASIEVREGRASLTISMGGFQQDDAPVEVIRKAIRFWAGTLG